MFFEIFEKNVRIRGNNLHAFLIKRYKMKIITPASPQGFDPVWLIILLTKIMKPMKTLQDESGKRKIVFLSQEDKDFLIYMYSDAWITPEIKRFKDSLLERVQLDSMDKDSDS